MGYTNGFVMTHLYSLFSAAHQSWMPYVYAVILGLIGCFLALHLEHFVIIMATSFGGAYAMSWGIIRLAWGSTHADLGPLYLFSGNGCEGSFCKVALICIVGVALLGAFVQFSHTCSHKTRFSRRASPQDVVVVHQYHKQDSTVLLINDQQVKGLQL